MFQYINEITRDGSISESVNELLMFFRAVSMISNFHRLRGLFLFKIRKHLLTLNWNIWKIYAHIPLFFFQVNVTMAFGTMPSGSTVVDQLARSAAAQGALRNLAHDGPPTKESRPGVQVDI